MWVKSDAPMVEILLPLGAKSVSKGEVTASGDAGVPGEVAGFGG